MNDAEEMAARYDVWRKRRAAGEEVSLTPAEAVDFIIEGRRRRKPITHNEFWEIMREGRTQSCDKRYEEKE